MNKIFFTIIFGAILIIPTYGQITNKARTTKRIETYLTRVEKVGFSGSVLVAIEGKEVLSNGYGFRNAELKEMNTPSTIFDIGSITKQFTAAAILKLEMQGKLATNNKISLYFPNVPVDKQAITIHDLLRHQSGLPSVVGGDYDKITETAFIDSAMKAPLRFKCGTKFSYSNIGYSLLAIIIEKVSGRSYEEYLYKNLWQPAKMESTGYTRPNFNKDEIAIGYKDGKLWGKPTEKEWDKDAPYWNLKGNGGILSTTEDLYKWNQAFLTDDILSKDAKQKYFHPKLRDNEDTNSYYAYGWDVHKTDRNSSLIQHNGFNGIFYADFFRFVDENVVVISLSNQASRNFMNINHQLAKIIFDPSYKPTIPIADNEANRNFTQKIINIILAKGLETAKKTYMNRNTETNLLEFEINTKGYDLLSGNKIDQAIAIFAMNVYAFPQSANAFDSLAEAYMGKGDNELATKYYKKSLSLNPENANAEEMLKKLEK